MLKIVSVSLLWGISILGLSLSIDWDEIQIERLLTLIFVVLSGLLPSIKRYDKVMHDISLQSALHVLSGVLSSVFYGVSCALITENDTVTWLFISFSCYSILIGYTHFVFTKIESLARILKVSLYSFLLSITVWMSVKGVNDHNDGKIDATELILPLISVWVTVYIIVILIKVHFLAPSIYGEQILINESSSDEEESEEEDGVLLRI